MEEEFIWLTFERTVHHSGEGEAAGARSAFSFVFHQGCQRVGWCCLHAEWAGLQSVGGFSPHPEWAGLQSVGWCCLHPEWAGLWPMQWCSPIQRGQDSRLWDGVAHIQRGRDSGPPDGAAHIQSGSSLLSLSLSRCSLIGMPTEFFHLSLNPAKSAMKSHHHR